MIYFIVAIVVFLIDQGTKWLIVNKLGLYESRPVIGEFFQITSHRNTGAAFSILEGQRWLFLVITTIVVAGVIWYLIKMIRAKRTLLSWALSLLLGGAVGNFLDRALHGEVVDFLQFRFQFSFFGKAVDYTFPIFNAADSAICIGVALIFLDALRGWIQERRGGTNEVHGS